MGRRTQLFVPLLATAGAAVGGSLGSIATHVLAGHTLTYTDTELASASRAPTT